MFFTAGRKRFLIMLRGHHKHSFNVNSQFFPICPTGVKAIYGWKQAFGEKPRTLADKGIVFGQQCLGKKGGADHRQV